MTATQLLAALGLLTCLALLAYPWLGAKRQARLRQAWFVFSTRLKLAWAQWRLAWARRGAQRVKPDTRVPKRSKAEEREEAERVAADLIERARRGKDGRDGANSQSGKGGEDNVIRPRFGGKRREDLH